MNSPLSDPRMEDPVFAFQTAIMIADVDLARRTWNDHEDLEAKLNQRNVWPLKEAVLRSSPEMIRFLVTDLHEDINQQDSNGWTALEFAVSFGHYSTAEALLNLGADSTLDCPIFQVASDDVEDPIAIVDLLIRFGADINQELRVDGMPPRNLLLEALTNDCEELAE